MQVTENKKKEIEALRDKLKKRDESKSGICVTCIHTESCAFLKGQTGPIWECGEFTTGLNTISRSKAHSRPAKSTQGDAADEGDSPDKLSGLCVNCVHNKACAFIKSEGVWHCENYSYR
jgi:hypothetical protein